MHYEWYYGAIAAALALIVFGIALYVFVRRSFGPTSETDQSSLADSPSLTLPIEPIYLKFSALASLNSSSRKYSEQSSEWRASMKRSGTILKNASVKEIILLHGTFVGSDPMNVVSSIKSVFPKLSPQFEESMSRRMKGVIDIIAQDNGNFIPAYVDLLHEALDAKIPVKLQFWSSANHHIARLDGAIRLLEKVSQDFPQKANDRILLIGHSHARQVFALFTQLIQGSSARSGLSAELWNFLLTEKLASEALRSKAEGLRKQRFDFVTLGGPVRYPWAFIPNMKALHIVNHSGETSSVLAPWSFWKARTGDFVQQWGMIGSDTISVTLRERHLNRGLDLLLGKGWHTRLWLQSIVRRERLGDFGRTLLIDYQMANPKGTNFIKSVFGHGVYTRFDVMHFQMELICKYIYS
ncbi:MAG: hypothetical protein EOP07_13930 [Proteobacteria bacterium]|nr:MAG: hypothetical protein EOP07_13930 [Pseudomonadota bacterium]